MKVKNQSLLNLVGLLIICMPEINVSFYFYFLPIFLLIDTMHFNIEMFIEQAMDTMVQKISKCVTIKLSISVGNFG